MEKAPLFTIESAGVKDLTGVQKLEKECFQRDAWSILEMIGVLSLPNIVRLKAVVGDRLIGFAAGDVPRGEDAGWIMTIGVSPDYRRQGVARALLTACEEQMPISCVKLCVRRSNHSAIALYEEAGYQQVEVWKRYYSGGEDALVLEKRKSAEALD